MELWSEDEYHPSKGIIFMNSKRFLVFVLALGTCGTSVLSVQAQPDINNAPKAENPPNWNMGGGGRRRGGRQPLTAEQLRQFRTQQTEMRAMNIRQQLTVAGYTDTAVQNAVVDHYKAQDAAQVNLLEQWQKIAQAVQAKNVADTEMATMLNDFRAAVAKEKERREASYKTLATSLDLANKPLLDALLMTMGMAGEEASIVGQNNAGGLGGLLNLLGNRGLGGAGGMGGFTIQRGGFGDFGGAGGANPFGF